MKPGYAPFKESWMSDMYSYSWIKMHVTEPAKNFYKDILVDNEMMQKLGKKIREAIHHNYRPRFDKIMETFKYQQSLKEFYGQFSRLIFHDRGLKTENGSVVSADLFASLLHSEFPYTEWTQVRSIVEEIGRALCLSNGLEQTRFDRAVSKHWKIPSQEKYISCSELIYLIEGLIVITVGKSRYKKDIVHDILGHMRKKGCLGPRPVIFADTNWIKDFFAFVVNPGNLELEFWSVDAYGLSAKPVSHWKMWLNGTRKEPDWGVFSKPHEYVGI
jgi:hypothetical protein